MKYNFTLLLFTNIYICSLILVFFSFKGLSTLRALLRTLQATSLCEKLHGIGELRFYSQFGDRIDCKTFNQSGYLCFFLYIIYFHRRITLIDLSIPIQFILGVPI